LNLNLWADLEHEAKIGHAGARAHIITLSIKRAVQADPKIDFVALE